MVDGSCTFLDFRHLQIGFDGVAQVYLIFFKKKLSEIAFGINTFYSMLVFTITLSWPCKLSVTACRCMPVCL